MNVSLEMVEATLELLRNHETEYLDEADEVGSCPECFKLSFEGHADDCPLKMVLAYWKNVELEMKK